LFAGSDRGGESAAAIYSLIGTAKLNGIDLESYLRNVLSRIAEHPINRIEEVSLTFSLYAGQQGGEPPWTETQNNVQMDSTGYTPQ